MNDLNFVKVCPFLCSIYKFIILHTTQMSQHLSIFSLFIGIYWVTHSQCRIFVPINILYFFKIKRNTLQELWYLNGLFSPSWFFSLLLILEIFAVQWVFHFHVVLCRYIKDQVLILSGFRPISFTQALFNLHNRLVFSCFCTFMEREIIVSIDHYVYCKRLWKCDALLDKICTALDKERATDIVQFDLVNILEPVISIAWCGKWLCCIGCYDRSLEWKSVA